MDVWEALVSTAVVGTERQAVDLPPQPGQLGALLGKLQGLDPEHTVMGAAAAVSLFRRAGLVPAQDSEPLPDPCPEDPLPLCDARMREALVLVLTGEMRVLPEWLTLAADAGVRLPDDLLPTVLDAAAKDKALREPLAKVAGTRGRWLAAMHPAWTYLLGEGTPDASAWASEHLVIRVNYLRHLRATDPVQARELLAARWKEDDPKTRAECLGTFAGGLNADDEPFLESALDDKRKEVRTVAIELLAKLPTSRLAREMLVRTRPLLAFTPAQKATLVATPPDACHKPMTRDGIEAKVPAVLRLGEKAWWLAQLVSFVPPSQWCADWQTTPAELATADLGEWKTALLYGWSMATQRFQDADWAEALAPVIEDQSRFPIGFSAMMQVLPPARREAFAIDRLLHLRQEGYYVLSSLLDGCPAWSEALSEAAIKQLREANMDRSYSSTLAILFHTADLRLYPACISAACQAIDHRLAHLPDDSIASYYEGSFNKLRNVLMLREMMYRAFRRG